MEKVSVIIPVYNHREFVGEAIDSVLQQTYSNIEIIVVDDGSTDGTGEVLERYNGKITIITQLNAGPSFARNTGIRTSSGDYICFLDSDDLFFPEKVERQLAAFRQQPEIGLVHTGAQVVRKNKDYWYKYIPRAYRTKQEQIAALVKSNFIVSSTVMVKRKPLFDAGLFSENYPLHQDYDMWLRMLAISPFGCIREVLLSYRWHGKNISRSIDKTALNRMKNEAAIRFGYLKKD